MIMYRVETTLRFDREFHKLDRYTQKMIAAWIEKNLDGCADPRAHGKGLTANRRGQWRYRIGDYRLLCFIEDDRLVILASSFAFPALCAVNASSLPLLSCSASQT